MLMCVLTFYYIFFQAEVKVETSIMNPHIPLTQLQQTGTHAHSYLFIAHPFSLLPFSVELIWKKI